MWVLSMLGALAGNTTILAIFAALAGGIGLFVAGGRANKDAARRAAEKLVAVEEPRNGPRGDRCRTPGARPAGRSRTAGGDAMVKALMLLLGCLLPK
ncbi:hypothetical protein [Mesorhizobium sp.]|uniref:hypothetical protein n=1 Tax=Mesorhizobium sp. TaxID=1871066 RepID=UPI00257EB67C|nr:hypothetical protein [Mesorhizobium sp.]